MTVHHLSCLLVVVIRTRPDFAGPTCSINLVLCAVRWHASHNAAWVLLCYCLQIVDSSSQAVVEVHKSGFPDAVVWNPWVAKAQAMADFGDEEYKVVTLASGSD